MKNELITNADRVRALQQRSRKTAFSKVRKAWGAAKLKSKEVGALTIEVANLLRECGLYLREASGHEQLSFSFYDDALNQGELPKDMRWEDMKRCEAIYRKHPDGPFETLQETREVVQQVLDITGESNPPTRKQIQDAVESNPVDGFIRWAAGFKATFAKLEDEPLQNWGREKLEKFVETTQPIFEKHVQAAAALELLGKETL